MHIQFTPRSTYPSKSAEGRTFMYFLSPCRKWHKPGSSPRNHSNAEVLRPRVHSNVVGFHGQGFIAMFSHNSLTISHDF